MPSPTVKQTSMWVSGLTTKDEEVLLTDGEWLPDNIINASQKLIKERYPHVCGFQNVCLGQTLGFEVTRGEFVQILHTGRGHWVTISTIGCENSEVQVFDSMPPAVTSSIKKQIATLVRNEEKNIILRYNNVEYI